MAAINNVLPGARKAVPYINETGESSQIFRSLLYQQISVIFCWKVLELNKVNLVFGH
jgi:hypothetical protein